MRQIKFRYRVETKDGIYTIFADLDELEGKTSIAELQELDDKDIKILSRDLWIGLLDKNGKEIYEGDKVQHNKYGREIVKFTNTRIMPFAGTELNYPWIYQDCEVIGNIYENPELLEEKK